MIDRSANSTPILPRAKSWWLGLALLLILAGWLYYRGYDTSLPYIDHPNEPAFNLAAKTIVDTGSARSVSFDAYPPGIITLNYLLIKFVNPPDAHFAKVLPALRLITISCWMLVVIVVALFGALVAGNRAGLMAAAIWVANPWIVTSVRFAVADGYVTFFSLLSLFLVTAGLKSDRRSLYTASIFCAFLAIVFKTQALLILPIVWLMPLVGARHQSGDASEIRKVVLRNGLRIGAFLFWLFFLYPTLEADRIPFWVAPSKSLSMPSAAVLWANLAPVLRTFQPLHGWLAVALLGTQIYRYRRRTNINGALAILLSISAWCLGVSLFGRQDIRHFYVAGSLLAIVYAMSITYLIWLLEEFGARLNKRGLLPRLQRALPSLIVSGLLLAGLYPSLMESLRIARQYTLHDRRNDLAQYMDTSLEPALYITNYDNHKTLNRSWGGYDGVHDFPRSAVDVLLSDKPIDDWRAAGVEYAIMPHWRMLEDPDSYHPDETVLLKTYPVDGSFRGPDMVVLRLYPMQYQTDQLLGPVRLVGYDINSTELQAGEDIVLRHYWRADHPTSTAHHVYNHLLDAASEIVSQTDYVPLWDSRRDTTSWDDPDEIMLGRNFTLNLPTDLPPGAYQLISGFYDPLTWQRLSSPEGADYLSITEITVTQADA